MGLREVNAARTRELILDIALDLFLEQGYDATKMEDVADGAGIGTSTLYRYFPTKDLLVLEPLAIRGQMAASLLSRPVDEPLDVALGHAVLALLLAPRASQQRLRQVHLVVETAAGLQARLYQEFVKERTLLTEAIAKRTGRQANDLHCVMTARMATVVLELVAEQSREVSDDPAVAQQQILDSTRLIMDQLHREPATLPKFKATSGR